MNDAIGHGDELAYLFELNDIYGNSLEAKNVTLSEDDQKVRDIFTQMIADFSKTGKVQLENKDVQPFSSEMNNFIQIKPKPVLGTGFKYCEVGLWFNLADRLKDTTCSFLKTLDTQVQNVKKVIGNVVNPIVGGGNGNIGDVVSPISNSGNIGLTNLLGGGKSSNKQKVESSKNQNALEMFGGGFLRPMPNSNQQSNQKPKQKPILPSIGGLNSFIG